MVEKSKFPLKAIHTPVLLFFAFLLVAPALSYGQHSSSDSLDNIIIGGNYDYPPYEFVDKNGQAAGYSTDLSRAVAEVMGVNATIFLDSWKNTRERLEKGDIDAIHGMYYSAERDKLVDFSNPHTIIHNTVFSRKESPKISSLEELRQKKIVVVEKGALHDYLKKNSFSEEIVLADSEGVALRLIASGQYDYALLGELPGIYLAKELKLSNIRVSGPSILPFKYCYAVKEGNHQLLSRINEALVILKKSGRYDKIHEKWLGVLEQNNIWPRTLLRYLFLFLVLVTLVFIIGLYWVKSLKKQVAFRTKELQEEVEVRKRAVRTLRESEERFDLAMEASQDGLFDWDLVTNEIYYSPGWKRMLGYEPDELPDDFSVWEKLTNPEDVKRSWAMQQELVQAQRDRFELEFKMKHKNGHWVDILSRANAVFDGDGKAVRIVGTHVDISGRKQAEEQLRKSENMFKALFQQAGGYCMILKPHESGIPTIFDANDAACKAHGYTREEIIGRPVADLDDEEGKRLCVERTKLIMSGKPLKIETNHVRKDGSIFPVAVHANLVHSLGMPPLIMTTEFDISHIRKSESDRLALEERLRHLQKMEAIGTLAGGIAHDFNNVLSPIMGYAEMVRDDLPKDSPARENLGEILAAAHRAKDLVKQILTFSRRTQEEKVPVNISSIVNEVVKFIRPSMPSTIKIKAMVEKDCGPVICEPSKIHQVIMNLCTNAFHAMRKTGGALEVNLASERLGPEDLEASLVLKPGSYVRLEVSDTGCGIDPQVMERIFDPYFTTKEVGEGTGMGLAVAHAIVEDCGGDIQVRSEPGKGTVFQVYLPKAESGEMIPVVLPEETVMTGTESVLLVDDEPPILKMMQRMLESSGYRVTAYSSSLEALEAFRAEKEDFDIVITDMTMPNMTGDALAREIMHIRPGVPVILCTGFSENITEEKAKQLGIAAYVMKPILMKEIVAAMRDALDKK